jgi:hypothetical protein
MHYTLIGDIHGHAEPLKALLQRLGYHHDGHSWRPRAQSDPQTLVFLGDFIDRGPEQLAVIDIVRPLVERGDALAIMGNHEFNAVAWATPRPDPHGERPEQRWLRTHSDKNLRQHRSFLKQVDDRHQEVIDWFKTLPLYLELDGLRAVHACWHRPSINALSGYLTDDGRLNGPDAWVAAATKPSHSEADAATGMPVISAFDAVEVLLKGWEIPLPAGRSFADKEGVARHEIRTRWWRPDGGSYRELALVPGSAKAQMPDDPIPASRLPGYDRAKPVFVGHYWLTGTPAPLTEHVACLDYSVASSKAGGKLCAYRWQGESTLNPAHYVWVDNSARARRN